MNRWYILFGLLGVSVIGLLSIVQKLISIPKRKQRTITYREELVELINHALNHGSLKENLYVKLVEESGSMQEELGADGVYAYAQDPLKNMAMKDYQLLYNFFSEIRLYISERDDSIMRNRFGHLAEECIDSFIRHSGTLTALYKFYLKQAVNPFVWIFEGMRIILSLPILLLRAFGVLSSIGVGKVLDSPMVKLLGVIATLAGIVSAIMSITMGWDKFLEMFHR